MGEIIRDSEPLQNKAEELKQSGGLVLADGAFDVIHPGHIEFLKDARSKGNFLVVALHSDEVIRSNKGKERPLNRWADRAAVLAALGPVDLIVEQNDRQPDEVIKKFKPTIYAKGTDFTEGNVREKQLVESLGGRIAICGGQKIHSTDTVTGRPQAFKSAWEGARSVPAQPGKLTIIVVVKNDLRNIRRCLESAKWADELIVVDSYSTDGTPQAALEYTPNVVQHEYGNYAKQQNWIIPQAGSEWVLVLDSDEEIPPELKAEVQKAMKLEGFDAFRVLRRTYFLGRMIDHCGWGRDFTNRLFKRDKGRYADKEVHANCQVPGKIGTIDQAYFLHYTDHDLKNYFEKFDRYSSLSAADMFRKGEKFRLWKLLIKPWARFTKMYIIKMGFLDGFEGFLLSGLSTMNTFARYAKLWEMEKNNSTGELPNGRR